MSEHKHMKLIALTIAMLVYYSFSYAGENAITVQYSKKIGVVNKKVFGNNVTAYDPETYETWHDWDGREYYGFSDYGAGIWDSKLNEPAREVINLAKDVEIAIMRFPGGCGSHHYDWKKTIGNNRKHFLYGLDEFLATCKEMGCEAVITVSYYTGDENDAADLVEYLNSEANGKNKWAEERVKNGHKEPYRIKYFEIGNEISHGDHKNIKKVPPETYGNKYLKYYEKMKVRDPTLYIGAVLDAYASWGSRALDIIKEKVDFCIVHMYPSPEVSDKQLELMGADDIFKITLAKPQIKDEPELKETLQLLKEKCGKSVPIAITEYNGGFTQEKPVPYRHCLGTALVNAELLRIFLKPENNILMANYWQFCNSYWGMISNGFDDDIKTLNNPYYKRPNYYVFEMYHKHFGDLLIDVDVKSDSYDVSKYISVKQRIKDFIKNGALSGKNLISGKWVIADLAGVNVIEKNDVLMIDFVNIAQFNYYHSIQSAIVEPATYYKLSGYIKTEGLNADLGVCLEVQDGRGWVKTHSAAATESISGTNDWQYVDVIYETLTDAKSVNIIARSIGELGPLKGRAYFKGVRFEKFAPSLDTKIPYLSVNASKSRDGNKVYLIVVNKNMDSSETTSIGLKDFMPANEINTWVLNGPSIDATNEVNHDNVKVTHKTFEISGNPFEFTFEPHSVTAIEIEKAK